jgi:hypothetical protein
MDFLRHRSLRILCALFALFVFAGDLVADAAYEASGACASDCQSSGCDSCPDCACPVHTGFAVSQDGSALVGHNLVSNECVAISDDRPALGVSPAIDHPPQLS